MNQSVNAVYLFDRGVFETPVVAWYRLNALNIKALKKTVR